MPEDYYEVLDVASDASQAAIEDAYRERVKETHPDLNDADDAAERFQAVKEAHETLGDPDERARYDRLGHGSYTSFGFGDGGESDSESDTTTGGFDVDFDVDFGVGDEAAGTDADTDFGSDPYASTESEDGSRSYDFSEPGWSESGWSDGTDRDRSDIFETAAEERRSGNRRHVRDEPSETNGETDGGFTVHGWDEESVESSSPGLRITQDRAVVAAIVFVLYPVFLYSSVSPLFSTVTNAVVGLCTLLTMGYLMTLPELGLVVFGAWSVLAPIFLVFMAPWDPLSLLGLFVLAVCWIPFGYSLMVARVTRW